MMGRKNIGLLMMGGLVILFSISLVGTAFAAQNAKKTVEVSSSHLRIDYENRVSYHKGNVRAVWKDMIMEADEMEIFMTEENALEKIVAKGNVKMIQKEEKREASGEMATYIAEEDKVTLEGKVHYSDEEGYSLTAEKIIIWIEAEKIEAEGVPVEIIITVE